MHTQRMAPQWTGSTNEEYAISTASMPAQALHIDIPMWYKFMAAWLLVVCIIIIPGNLLTIVAYFRFKALHTGANMLICNQSIMDFLTGVGSPVYVYLSFTSAGLKTLKHSKYTCLLVLWILSFPFISSVINILAISIERLVAVCFPFANIRFRKKQIVLLSIIVAWSVLILSLSLPIMGWNQWSQGSQCALYIVYTPTYVTYFIMVPIFGSLGITAIINLIILIFLRRRHTRVTDIQTAVNLTEQPSGTQPVNSTHTSNTSTAVTNNPHEMKMRFNRKVTRMLLIVVGVFYLCWIPYTVCTITFLVSPFHFRHIEMVIVHEFSKGLMALNGFLNPFIYATRNKAFGNAFKKLLSIKNIQK